MALNYHFLCDLLGAFMRLRRFLNRLILAFLLVSINFESTVGRGFVEE